MKRLGILAVVALALFQALVVSAQEISVVAEFDPALGELPEAIAIGPGGDAFLSMASGEIKRVTADGAASTFANLPSPGQDGFVTGAAFGPDGNLFVGLGSFDPETHGIWRVDPDGNEELFLSLDAMSLPNGITFNANGDMFVSDSFGGQILKVSASAEMTVWNSDSLLAPGEVEPLPFSVGPNGIAFDAGEEHLYAVTTGTGRVVRIPVEADGSAGDAELVVEDLESLGGADGVVFDSDGTLYVAVFIQDSVVSVSPTGEVSTIVEGAPLQNPSDLAFSNGGELLVTNFAVLRALGLQDGVPEPALLRLTIATDETTEPDETTTPVALPETGSGSAPSNGMPVELAFALAAAGLFALGGWAAVRLRART